MGSPGMGTCYPSGTGVPQQTTIENCREVWGPDARWEQSGHEPIDSGGGGFCAVKTILARALGENILLLGSTYHLTYQFRDQILSKSDLGKRMLNHYYENAGKIYSLVISDPVLLAKSILAWYNTWPFVTAMLGTINKDAPDVLKKSKIKFSKKLYSVINNLIKDFKNQSNDKELHSIMNEAQIELGKFVGKSPKEAIELLIGNNASEVL